MAQSPCSLEGIKRKGRKVSTLLLWKSSGLCIAFGHLSQVQASRANSLSLLVQTRCLSSNRLQWASDLEPLTGPSNFPACQWHFAFFHYWLGSLLSKSFMYPIYNTKCALLGNPNWYTQRSITKFIFAFLEKAII